MGLAEPGGIHIHPEYVWSPGGVTPYDVALVRTQNPINIKRSAVGYETKFLNSPIEADLGGKGLLLVMPEFRDAFALDDTVVRIEGLSSEKFEDSAIKFGYWEITAENAIEGYSFYDFQVMNLTGQTIGPGDSGGGAYTFRMLTEGHYKNQWWPQTIFGVVSGRYAGEGRVTQVSYRLDWIWDTIPVQDRLFWL